MTVWKNDNETGVNWHLWLMCSTSMMCQIITISVIIIVLCTECIDICSVAFVWIISFLLQALCSSMLQYMGNYHNLYKASKKICCFVKPVVHQSMIFDYLNDPTVFSPDTENGSFPEFFKIFLFDKDQLSIPDPVDGNTVLHYAYKHKRFAELQEMLKMGGNPFVKNNNGQSIEFLIGLKKHCSEEFLEIEKMIKEAKQNIPEETNESLVHKAVRENDLKKLKLYHKFGALLSSYNSKGQTPKDVAIEKGFLDIVKYIELSDQFESNEVTRL